jgi:hypothetical protein
MAGLPITTEAMVEQPMEPAPPVPGGGGREGRAAF